VAEADGGELDDDHPGIDVSGAVGEAGHELEELGATDTPDAGPVVKTSEEVADEEARDVERDVGLGRGVFGGLESDA
jgi:hypothetical protein